MMKAHLKNPGERGTHGDHRCQDKATDIYRMENRPKNCTCVFENCKRVAMTITKKPCIPLPLYDSSLDHIYRKLLIHVSNVSRP